MKHLGSSRSPDSSSSSPCSYWLHNKLSRLMRLCHWAGEEQLSNVTWKQYFDRTKQWYWWKNKKICVTMAGTEKDSVFIYLHLYLQLTRVGIITCYWHHTGKTVTQHLAFTPIFSTEYRGSLYEKKSRDTSHLLLQID